MGAYDKITKKAKRKRMMKKIVRKAILSVLLILFIITLLVIGYYFVVDIETKEPEEVKAVCELKTENYKDRKVFIISPKEGIKTEQKILYFHGGSYVAEASKEHWKFIEKLVLDTKATIIMPDYPLTPKYHYQDVFAMVEPLYKEIIEKVKPEQLIVMGDSAGGGLGLALLEKVSQEGISMPEKTILISPWLDVRLKNPKIAQVQEQDKELNKETLRLAGIAYSGEEGKDSYLVNPIEGDLSKLKNITIFTGTYDILNPDVYVLKEKAEQVKVKIEVKEYEKARSYMDNSRKK